MGTPHKHAKFIKAWADGKEIEYFDKYYKRWLSLGDQPFWFENFEFRIKPEPKPDTVSYYNSDYTNAFVRRAARFQEDVLKLTFDGETGKLKSAEVLK